MRIGKAVKENPLGRLLRPDGREERERNNLSAPRERQDPLLRLLATYPSNFKADFLELPARKGLYTQSGPSTIAF